MDRLRVHGEAWAVLVARQVGVVESHFAASHHGDLHALGLTEPVEDLLEGH